MKFRNKIAALFGALALALAMALVPTAATAEPVPVSSGTTGKLTITGVANGDEVTVWRVVDAVYNDDTHALTYQVNGNFTEVYADLNSYMDAVKPEASTSPNDAANSLAAYAVEHEVAGTSKVAEGTSVTFENLPMGSYLVVVTKGTESDLVVYQNTIVNLVPEANEEGTGYELSEATAQIKATKIPFDKTVDSANDGKYNDGPAIAYGLNDHVPFKIDTVIPAYPENATSVYFAIGDELTQGLEFTESDENGLKVMSGSTELEPGDSGAYTIVFTDGNKFEIVFNEAWVRSHPNTPITVSYTAMINSTAAENLDGTDVNTATLTYSNKPFDGNEYDTKTDDVKVKTFGLYIFKTGKDNKPLSGAVFTVRDSDNNIVGTITTGEDGYGELSKLEPGTYSLSETTVPAGYVAVPDFTMTITATSSADYPATEAVESFYVGAEKQDQEQPTLPTTGGPGTLALTIGGVFLIVAGIVLVARVTRKAE